MALNDIRVQMVLECVSVNDDSDGPECIEKCLWEGLLVSVSC